MPNYEWSCLACGNANCSGTSTCKDCGCSESASLQQIKTFRQNFVNTGGAILSSAGKLHEDGENEILTVFAKLILKIIVDPWLPSIKK